MAICANSTPILKLIKAVKKSFFGNPIAFNADAKPKP